MGSATRRIFLLENEADMRENRLATEVKIARIFLISDLFSWLLSCFFLCFKWTVFLEHVNLTLSTIFNVVGIINHCQYLPNVNKCQILCCCFFVSTQHFSSSLFTLSTIVNLVDNVNNCQIVVVVMFVSISGEQAVVIFVLLLSSYCRYLCIVVIFVLLFSLYLCCSLYLLQVSSLLRACLRADEQITQKNKLELDISTNEEDIGFFFIFKSFILTSPISWTCFFSTLCFSDEFEKCFLPFLFSDELENHLKEARYVLAESERKFEDISRK